MYSLYVISLDDECFYIGSTKYKPDSRIERKRPVKALRGFVRQRPEPSNAAAAGRCHRLDEWVTV
jgi:hypothetical protein